MEHDDPFTAEKAALALGKLKYQPASDPSAAVRREALIALGDHPDMVLPDIFVNAMFDIPIQ